VCRKKVVFEGFKTQVLGMYIPRTFCNWIILCSYLSSGIRTVWHCKCAIVVVHWLVYNMYNLSPPSSFLLTIVACFWRNFQLPFSPIAAMFLEKFLASLLTCCCMFLENFWLPFSPISACFWRIFWFPFSPISACFWRIFWLPFSPISACFWRNFQLPLSTIAATVIH